MAKKYKDLQVTKERNAEGENGWLSHLRSAYILRGIAIAAKRGEQIYSETLSIGRDAVESMCNYFMRIGTPSAFLDRAVFVTDRLAIGRAVEVGLTSYTSASWDMTKQKLMVPWNEIKTGKVVPMPFGKDLKSYKLAFLQAMGCLHVMGWSKS